MDPGSNISHKIFVEISRILSFEKYVFDRFYLSWYFRSWIQIRIKINRSEKLFFAVSTALLLPVRRRRSGLALVCRGGCVDDLGTQPTCLHRLNFFLSLKKHISYSFFFSLPPRFNQTLFPAWKKYRQLLAAASELSVAA